MKNQTQGLIGIALAAALFSSGGFLVKIIDLPPLAITGYRSIIVIIMLLLCGLKPKIQFSWPYFLGAIGCSGNLAFIIVATKYTTAANAIFLQFTVPAYVAILSYWALKEKMSNLDKIITPIVLGGIALFFLDTLTPMGLTGVFCGIGAGICWACFILCLRKLKDQQPLQFIMFAHILVAIATIPFTFQKIPSSENIIPLTLLGVFQWGIPALLFAAAIKHVRAVQAVVVQTLEPVLNPIWVFFTIGEIPGPWALVGGSIVVCAVLVHGILSAKEEQNNSN